MIIDRSKKLNHFRLLRNRKHPLDMKQSQDWMDLYRASMMRKLAHLVKQQDGLCCFCGCSMELITDVTNYVRKGQDATLEHKIPKTFGGGDSLRNLAASCASCNRFRGAYPFDEFKALMEPVFNSKNDMRIRQMTLHSIKSKVTKFQNQFKTKRRSPSGIREPNPERDLRKEQNLNARLLYVAILNIWEEKKGAEAPL